MRMNFMAIGFSPLASSRTRMSPIRPRCTASGLSMTKVRSIIASLSLLIGLRLLLGLGLLGLGLLLRLRRGSRLDWLLHCWGCRGCLDLGRLCLRFLDLRRLQGLGPLVPVQADVLGLGI